MDDPLFSPPIRPWARLFAFWFDMTLFFLPVELIWQFVDPVSYVNFLSYGIPMAMAKTVTALPLSAICISLFGTTPGKALLCCRLTATDGERITFTRAFKRCMYSFWFGALGQFEPMGYIAMYFSYRRLAISRTTSWDVKFHTQVLHMRYTPWKIAVFAVVIVGCLTAEGLSLMRIFPELLASLGLELVPSA